MSYQRYLYISIGNSNYHAYVAINNILEGIHDNDHETAMSYKITYNGDQLQWLGSSMLVSMTYRSLHQHSASDSKSNVVRILVSEATCLIRTKSKTKQHLPNFTFWGALYISTDDKGPLPVRDTSHLEALLKLQFLFLQGVLFITRDSARIFSLSECKTKFRRKESLEFCKVIVEKLKLGVFENSWVKLPLRGC